MIGGPFWVDCALGTFPPLSQKTRPKWRIFLVALTGYSTQTTNRFDTWRRSTTHLAVSRTLGSLTTLSANPPGSSQCEAFVSRACSYDATLFSHVVRLDSNALITAVTCRSDGVGVDIGFSDLSGAEALVPGTILAGSSEAWNCKNTDGVNMPFTKGVVGIDGLTLRLRAADGTILSMEIPGDVVLPFTLALSRSGSSFWAASSAVGLSVPVAAATAGGGVTVLEAELHLLTENVPPTHCFEHMTLNFHRTAGAGEAELRRRLQVRL